MRFEDLNWMDVELWKHPEKFKAESKRYDCPSCEKEMFVLEYGDTGVDVGNGRGSAFTT